MVCQFSVGTSNVFNTAPCSQQFTPTEFVDWGSPIDGVLTGPGYNVGGLGDAVSNNGFPFSPETFLNAAIDGDPFTIVSNEDLERADNAARVWNGSGWGLATFVNPNNTYFAGHFGGATTPLDPPYGDNLLGAIAPSGPSDGPNPIIALTFTQTLTYIAFQVSAASTANFSAELIAFDANNNQIGIYQIQSTGGGGVCAGLAVRSGPQPCNDAPLIQFFDPQSSIHSVELVMLGDLSGVFINELQAATPEPGAWLLLALGLGAIGWTKRRRKADGEEPLAP